MTVPSGPTAATAGRKLPPYARRRQLRDAIQDSGSATVARLAHELGVSPVTIHRDLAQLELDGFVTRVHGGATWSPAPGGAQYLQTVWQERLQVRPISKLLIAIAARTLLERDSTIFLDGSTSAFTLAVAIEADPLPITIVTVSPLIALTLQAPSVDVVIAPGHLDRELGSVRGNWTTEFIGELNLSSSFVSGAGFSARQGLTTARREIAEIARQAMTQSMSTVCLVDASKIGKSAMMTVGRPSDFATIVTDHDLDEVQLAELVSCGTPLIRTDPTATPQAEHLLRTSRLWSMATDPGHGVRP